MSKIKTLRFINLNYNNNAIRISDETFDLDGESTLLSLQNGGGKSVMVQMVMAPFLHPRFRRLKDRTFESYFTSTKPSFLLVEWELDHNAGYVLTGMMVRRNQNTEYAGVNPLEGFHFIAEYKEACIYDIHHLPVVEKSKHGIILKNYSACKQILEEYKKDPEKKFNCFDMNIASQVRQYFKELHQYQINEKEWESIIRKVNLKESGLSDLFADCKDERGLIEKWFLESIETKLNKDSNRIEEFQSLISKYIGQYRINRSKIQRRDIIRRFKEEAVEIYQSTKEYIEICEQADLQENRFVAFRLRMKQLLDQLEEQIKALENDIFEVDGQRERVIYEKHSYGIHTVEASLQNCLRDLNLCNVEKEDLERQKEQAEKKSQRQARRGQKPSV